MRKSTRTWGILAVLAGVLLVAGVASAQTTGLIEGTVHDKDDKPLPGVTVQIESPAMQGTRVVVTDANGKFRFPGVPPGAYVVTTSLDGFGTLRQEDVDVGLDKTVTLRVTMQPAAFEQVLEVTGEAPVVDVTSTELGINIGQDFLTKVPFGRNFANAAGITPGAQYEDDTTGGYAISGSTGAENSYIIDGVDSTEVERGRQGKSINMEFIEEVQVKTGGYNAEYGRATGGVINVITKSGGNEFRGDVFGYYESDSTQADLDPEDFDLLTVAPTTSSGLTRQDYGFDLGGYIVKDKLWFFVAYDLVKREERSEIDEFIQTTYGAPPEAITDREEDQRAAKLTWNINPSHTFIGSLFGDPEDWVGDNGYAIYGAEDTWQNTRTTGGDNYTFRYLGLPTEDLLINAQWAHHEEEDSITPDNATDIQVRDRRSTDEFRTGGLGYYYAEQYEREGWQGDLTWFVEAAGTHELKFGYGQQELTAVKNVRFTGGQVVWIYGCSAAYNQALCLQDPVLGGYAYMHEAYLTERSTLADWEVSPTGYTNVPFTDNTFAFFQDSWRVLPNLTLNLGFRWEEQALNGGDREWIKIDDNYAPRIGLVWDVKNDGSSKVYGHWGRFYESIPMDINIRFMGSEVSSNFYNTDPLDPTPNQDLRVSRIRGSLSTLEQLEIIFGSAVDPNLEGQYMDELILGYETSLIEDWTFGIGFVQRELKSVIEDGGAVINGELGYLVGNAGVGFLSQAPSLADGEVYPVPVPKRDYTGVSLTARKRFKNNWTVFASYTWSELEGTYDGTYQRSTGQLDPNINSAYDYVDFHYVVTPGNPFTVPLDGPLSNDREHNFKVSGYYTFDFGLEIGANVYYQSGRPITAQGWSDDYRNNELSLSQRGELGRMDAEYEMDLHFGYPFNLSDAITLNLFVDVFNVLDRQGATDLNMLYDVTQGGLVPPRAGCEAYVGQSFSTSIPRECAPNPDYLLPTDWQDPRIFRLGAKISF